MQRIKARIAKPKRTELFDAAIPPVKGHSDWRRLTTDELWTPGGVPLRLFVEVGPTGDQLIVYSAQVELLEVSAGSLGSATLLLSTEELLHVLIGDIR